MPNWVKNVLSFKGDKEKIAEMMELIKNDERGVGSIDFRKIVPYPDYIFQGNVGHTEEVKYGRRNWYDWNRKFWGTKWNADCGEFDGTNISFDTAWSAPIPVIETLSWLFADIEIHLDYADEDYGSNCGSIDFKGGCMEEHGFDNEIEAEEFAFSLWGEI